MPAGAPPTARGGTSGAGVERRVGGGTGRPAPRARRPLPGRRGRSGLPGASSRGPVPPGGARRGRVPGECSRPGLRAVPSGGRRPAARLGPRAGAGRAGARRGPASVGLSCRIPCGGSGREACGGRAWREAEVRCRRAAALALLRAGHRREAAGEGEILESPPRPRVTILGSLPASTPVPAGAPRRKSAFLLRALFPPGFS